MGTSIFKYSNSLAFWWLKCKFLKALTVAREVKLVLCTLMILEQCKKSKLLK